MRFLPAIAGLVFLFLAALPWERPAERQPTATVAEPSVPGHGMSDLDRILRSGLNGELPKNFRALVTFVEQHTDGTADFVFIPRGRSLVRSQTDYHDPRLVIGMFTDSSSRLGKDGVDTHGHGIFLAYSKRAELVEAISFNETLGRFEFQLIEDFASKDKKLKPRVSYADRSVCLACHKLGTPIFSVGTWQETLDHNPKLYDKVREALGAKNDHEELSYEGFPLPNQRPDPDQFSSPGQDFEGFANNASARLATNTLWRDLCRKEPSCRVDLVRFALLNLAELWDLFPDYKTWEPHTKAYASLKKLFTDRYKGKFDVLSPTLADRDPFRYPEISGGHDPVLAEYGIAGRYLDDFAINAFVSNFVEDVFDKGDGQRFRKYLEAQRGQRTYAAAFVDETAKWTKQVWATNDEPLQRCAVLAGILPGVTNPGCAPAPEAWRAPGPRAVPASSDPQLVTFQQYCASCHQPKRIAPAFLETGRESFETWAHCIAKVLPWDKKGEKQMPPDSSPLHDALKAKPEIRARMLSFALRSAEERSVATRTKLKPPVPACPSSAGKNR